MQHEGGAGACVCVLCVAYVSLGWGDECVAYISLGWGDECVPYVSLGWGDECVGV